MKMILRGLFLACTISVLWTGMVSAQSSYPAAEGFNVEGSDQKAIEIADKVMETMGGWESWNQTRYLTWVFFGNRIHYWDKYTGNIRVESPKTGTVVLMNIHTKEGRAWENDEEVVEKAKLEEMLQGGYEAWINDSYWLVMPFKLKDSGVTLKYLGERESDRGRASHVLQLTFENVGVTPQNKYEIFVDPEKFLVTHWSFFPTADDAEPRFTTPWDDWQVYGRIMLSGNRGKYMLSKIAVFQTLPESIFKSQEPVKLE